MKHDEITMLDRSMKNDVVETRDASKHAPDFTSASPLALADRTPVRGLDGHQDYIHTTLSIE